MQRYSLLILILLFSNRLLAQENTCETTRRAALAESFVICSSVEAGQACYGNSLASAETHSENLAFAVPSDTLALNELASITSATGENQYGMVYLRTTAYHAENWQPYDLSLFLIGDATIANNGQENLSIPTVDATIIGAQGANVRSGPSPDYRVITALFEGDLVKLTGRFRDDSFYRTQLPSGQSGWIAAGAMNADVSSLPLLNENDPVPDLLYMPYAALSLTTNPTEGTCTYEGDSGVLVQTPTNTSLRMNVNGAEILLSGTAFIETRENDLRILAIEGELSYGEFIAEEGFLLRLPLIDGQVTAGEVLVAAYPFETYKNLPTEILPRFVYVGIDLTSIITPAPTIDRSPIADVLATAPCVITTGQTGANLRGGPGAEFPLRGVLAYRETVNPIGRTTTNGQVWWELAQNVWVNSAVVVTGGDCAVVPASALIPIFIPSPTPEN